MTSAITTLEPSEKNPLSQFSAKTTKSVQANGRSWTELTYVLYKYSLCQRILLGCLALLATIALVPLAVCFARVKHLWEDACCTTQKIVRIAKEKLLPAVPQFKEVPQEEILLLQPDIKKTFFDLHEIPEDEWPQYKLQLDDVTYYCSKPTYNENIVRPAVITLICKSGQVFPRVYYFSNSQASWRVAPYIEYDPFYIGKGKNENETQLPIAVQLALNKLPTQPKMSIVPLHDMTGQNEFEQSVEIIPFSTLTISPDLLKYLEEEGKIWQLNPTDIHLPDNAGLHPNFEAPILVTDLTCQKYGRLKVSWFPSKDRSTEYLFYENQNGLAFLAGAEKVKDNPINQYGVRKFSYKLWGLDAPLIEHASMISKRFWAEATWKPNYPESRYSLNWNYVRQLKIIQDYYSAQKRQLPETAENYSPPKSKF